MGNTYWLFNWLDAHGIHDLAEAKHALSLRSNLEDLRYVASQAVESLPHEMQSENVILAGRGLDLTSSLHCYKPVCRHKQVDELFRKAWHYFDQIVVDDAVAHKLLFHWDKLPEKLDRLLTDIEVLLYLRTIGADELVEFRLKPGVRRQGWRDRAKRAGLELAVSVADTLVPQIAREARIEFRPRSKGISSYSFNHPKFEIVVHGDIKVGGVSGKPTDTTRKAVAREVLGKYFPHLTVDISTAVALGVPLGCANWFHGEILSSVSRPLSPANVAFNLELPVLQGIPIETLLQVRRDEFEGFQRFRDSLRLAIKEGLKNSPSVREAEISEQIRMDVIEPELRIIRDRLKAAEKALAKKSVVGIFMGGLVTTCGILAGLPVPISIAAGVGAVSSSETGAVAKYLDEKQQVALSDMYFLWNAVKHSSHEL